MEIKACDYKARTNWHVGVSAVMTKTEAKVLAHAIEHMQNKAGAIPNEEAKAAQNFKAGLIKALDDIEVV